MKNFYFFCISIVFAILFSSNGFSQGSANVPLLKQVNDYAGIGYNDCWGYVDADGREYALLGVRNGTSIVDITDAATAAEITFIGSATSTWKDIKTYQTYAYTMTESNKTLQIIDLSNLPTSASLVGNYTLQTSGNPHNIFIDEAAAVLYVADDFDFGSSVHAYSLADPLNPVQIADFGTDCHDMFAQDGILFTAEGVNNTLGMYDVNDPANPILINRITIPASGYVHNVWPTEDNMFIMSTEETNGKTIKYWDVSDKMNPVLTDTYLAPNNLAHNAHIKGNYSYISHYGSGLRIVDISNPNNIFEAGFYDTADAWGAYPFFPSGKVIISDVSNGLYIVFFEGAVESEIKTFQQSVSTGWNLIGLPYSPDEAFVDSVFPSAVPNTLFSYDGGYKTESELEKGKGYWLKFNESVTVPVIGREFNSATLTLSEGWNLISGVSCDIDLQNIDDPNGIIISGTLFEFNGAYNSSTRIDQGKGYWIRTNAAGQISLDCASAVSKSVKNPQSLLASFGELTLTEKTTGFSQKLYLGQPLPDIDLRSYSLPPKPQAEAFDARFADDTRVSENLETTIYVQSTTSSLELTIENLDVSGYVLQVVSNNSVVRETELRNGTAQVQQDNVSEIRIRKGSDNFPTQFTVYQNYPNPFNPTTEIRYDLSEAATVQITVYNTVGQKVQTVFNGLRPAGIHTVQWNGVDENNTPVSSGFYFYEVSIGNKKQINRMLLIK